MYNPIDNLCPGGFAGYSQYRSSARLLVRNGTLLDTEATRNALRSGGNWIHPSDLVNPEQYWYAPREVPSTEDGAFENWVASLAPSPWVAHVGAIGKSALDKNTRDPAASTNTQAFERDIVHTNYRVPPRT